MLVLSKKILLLLKNEYYQNYGRFKESTIATSLTEKRKRMHLIKVMKQME